MISLDQVKCFVVSILLLSLMTTFTFLQLMHMDVKYSRILIQPLPNHVIKNSSAKQSTVVLRRTVLHGTKSTFWLWTRLSTDVRHQPVTLLSISSAVEGRTNLLYWCLEATNLLTGLSRYQSRLPSVKSFWWVHNQKMIYIDSTLNGSELLLFDHSRTFNN